MKDAGHWECSQIQLPLDPNEVTLSILSEVLLFAFKDGKQDHLEDAEHQNFDSCTKWKWK